MNAAAGLRVKRLALPGLPPKGDVSDWLDAGHSPDELAALADAAPVLTLDDVAPWSDSPAEDDDRPAASGVDFPLHDAAAAGTWDFPPPTFIIDQLLPLLGTVWIAGLPKRGKSLLVLYLALAIACRRPTVCTRFAVRGFPRILYVTREDGGPRLKERIADILSAWPERPGPDALRFVIKPRIDLMNVAHVTWLRETCQRDGITVLILDTWTALSPAADPLGTKDQTLLAAIVVQLAEDLQGLVIVVDHSRKNRPEGSILSATDLFGPPQKWQAAEHVLMLDHAGTDESRWQLFVEGKDTDSARVFLTKSPRGSRTEKLTYAGDAEALGTEARARGDANRHAVLAALRAAAGAWLSTAEIVEALARAHLKLSRDTVRRHLAALLAEGAPVDQGGQGRATRYCATDVLPQAPSAANHGAANE
jgi:biotin operon repressor